MRRLVLLRPEPGATASAAVARRLGMVVVVMPLFAVVAVPWVVPDPGEFDALLLTSANAVRQAGDGLGSLAALPVAAVGHATSAAARAAGLTVMAEGAGGIDDVLAAVPKDLHLLHLSGRDRIAPADGDRSIEVVTVYETRLVTLDRPARLKGSVVALHSPRAAARFAGMIEPSARTAIALVALSPAVAAAAASGWERVEVAEMPDDAALLALAARLCL